MKRLFNLFALVLFSSVLLINCGDDDDNADALAALVGIWRSSSIATTGCTDATMNGTLTCDPYCMEITINSDGSYSLTNNADDPPSTETGTVTATATTILVCATGDPDCGDPSPYTLSGSTFIVTFTDDDSPGCAFAATFNKQ